VGRQNSTYLSSQPETAANKDEEVVLNNTGSVPTALVSSAAGAAGSLAGWAISSISKVGWSHGLNNILIGMSDNGL
jgi:hypothetical protein